MWVVFLRNLILGMLCCQVYSNCKGEDTPTIIRGQRLPDIEQPTDVSYRSIFAYQAYIISILLLKPENSVELKNLM